MDAYARLSHLKRVQIPRYLPFSNAGEEPCIFHGVAGDEKPDRGGAPCSRIAAVMDAIQLRYTVASGLVV